MNNLPLNDDFETIEFDDPIQNFPDELKDDTFVCWGVFKWEKDRKTEKSRKVPYNAETHRQGNPFTENGRAFGEACLALEDKTHEYAGLAFGFRWDDGLTGVDIDDCVNPTTGVILSWAMDVIREVNSYTEVSVSGTGIHIVVKGWQVPRKKKGMKKDGVTIDWQEGYRNGIEIYSGSRYFTASGNHLAGTPTIVESRDLSAIFKKMQDGFYKALVAEEQAKTTPTPEVSAVSTATPATAASVVAPETVSVKDKAPLAAFYEELGGSCSPDAAKPFFVYHNGSEYQFPSGSEADYRLCELLAREYSEEKLSDAEGIYEAMWERVEESVLSDEKWEREDYRRRTIAAAATAQLEYIQANDTEKVSDLLKNGIWLNGPRKGMRYDGADANVRVLMVAANAIPTYDHLITDVQLAIPRVSWIESNVPIPSLIEHEERRFFVDAMIMEHGLHLISAEKGSMKTMLQMMLAKSLCTGTDLLGRKNLGVPLTVVYVDRENPKAEMQIRMHALGLHNLKNFHMWGDWSPKIEKEPPKSMGDPRFWEQAMRNPSTFFMFDSLSSFVEGANESDTAEMLPVIQRARHLARNSAGVSAVHHTAKNRKDQARGAGVIADQTDMAFVMKKHGENGAVLWDERFRGIASWRLTFDMNWGSGLNPVYTPTVIKDTMKSGTQRTEEAATKSAGEEAMRVGRLQSAAQAIHKAYDAAVAGKGDCISSKKQLIEILGWKDGQEARDLIAEGTGKSWHCVSGSNNRTIYLPNSASEVPGKPPKEAKPDPRKKTAATVAKTKERATHGRERK